MDCPTILLLAKIIQPFIRGKHYRNGYAIHVYKHYVHFQFGRWYLCALDIITVFYVRLRLLFGACVM